MNIPYDAVEKAARALLKLIDNVAYRDSVGLRLTDVVPQVENLRAALTAHEAARPDVEALAVIEAARRYIEISANSTIEELTWNQWLALRNALTALDAVHKDAGP